MSATRKIWESYEDVATFLLNQIAEEFGLERFEGKQMVTGKRSGSRWEIDAKGVSKNSEIFLIVECRRHTSSRQNQERIGGLAYGIIDSDAKGGIVVSPLGLQEGATRIAQAENIYNVILDENSSNTEFVLKFLDKVRVGKHLHSSIEPTGTLSAKLIRKGGTVVQLGELKPKID